MRKLLLVSNFYPPENLGGVQFYTHGIATEMQKRGYQAQVICVGDWDKGKMYFNGVTNDIFEGISVRRLHLNWAKAIDPFRYLYDSPVAAIEFERMIDIFQPDMIHINSCSTLSVSSIFVAKKLHIPVILTLHDFWFLCPRFTLLHANESICSANVSPWECTKCLAWGAKIYRWPKQFLSDSFLRLILSWAGLHTGLNRRRGLVGMIGSIEDRRTVLSRAFSMVDVILAVSDYVKKIFTMSPHLSGNIHRIQVNEQGLVELPTPVMSHPTPKSSVHISYFGRLAYIKGLHVLVEAFKNLHGNVELHIYGDAASGDKKEYMSQLSRLAMRVQRIYFHGAYQHLEMPLLLKDSDIVVVPSIVPETYNLVVREALTANVPVVASRIGAIPDAVIHGVNGLLVEPGNVEELALALQRFVDDCELNSQFTSHEFTVKTKSQECDELLEIYKSLL